MYKDMGWNVIVQIASPLMVVKAATGLNEEKSVSVTPKHKTNTKESNCIRELALDTLDQVERSQCNRFVFHAFSNGGAFLWEEVRNIIKGRKEKGSSDNRNSFGEYNSIQNKLVGLVFDSAPAYYAGQDTLMKALSYATAEEQEEGKALIENAKYEMGDDAFSKSKGRRACQYWQGMLDDNMSVPHLYLYSKVDPLTSHKKLKELIHHRRKKFGEESVSSLCFDDSPHCCHFLKHPTQYQTKLERFLTAKCMAGPRSKL